MLNRDKIPKFIDYIVSDFLTKLEYIDYDSAFCNVMFWSSVLLCSCRVKIVDEYRKIEKSPNLYILKFGGIGSGKGRTSKTVEWLLDKWKDSMDFREIQFRKSEQSAIEGSAALSGIKTGAKKFDLIEKMMPPQFMPIITSSSTPEGIMAQRAAMEKAGFGCLYWIENEIYDMLEKCFPGTRQWDIMTIMKEVFDNGFIDPKLIAGNKKLKKTKAIPHCAFLQGAIDDEKGSDPFIRFFKLGYARRLILCNEKIFQDKNKRDRKIIQKLLMEANKEEPSIKLFFRELYLRVQDGFTYTLSDEVKDAYDDYKEDCRVQALKTPRNAGGTYKELIANKWWNALNVAAIYESVNSSSSVISLKSFHQAIYMVDYFAKDFAEFCGLGVMTTGRNLYEAMMANGARPTSYWTSLPIFPKNRSKGYKMFHEAMEDVSIIAAENDQMIFKDTKHPRHIEWSIIKRPVEFDTITMMLGIDKKPETYKLLREQFGDEMIDLYLKN